MRKRFTAILWYSLFWLVFFIFARLFFILFHHKDSFKYGLQGLAATFIHGVKLDISTTSYYLLLPMLTAVAWVWTGSRWYRMFMRIYTCILVVFSSAIIVSDAKLYSYWGYRMDYTPFFYLKTPGEAMASVETGDLVLFFLSIAAIAAVFIYIFMKFSDRRFGEAGIVSGRAGAKISLSFAVLILTAALIIPVRGGFGVAPINAGSVYFSPEMFLNHTAVNAVWNVGTTAFTQKPVDNPYSFFSPGEAKAAVDSLNYEKGKVDTVLTKRRPNVLFIILESFSAYLVGPAGGDSLVTPNLNRYIREGLFFSNFYASGNRTDKAMPAILNGYPAQPAQSIIKEPRKSQSLPGIVKILNDNGYNSSFWYGGEIDFANFNSYVLSSGFKTLVTMDDFDPSDYNSKWGVHDHIMFSALRDSMKSVREPFLKVVLTLSSHEPFDVPMEPVFRGSDQMTKYRNSVYYADKALGDFLDWARTTEWWKNTLVILVADHCCRISTEVPVYSQEIFRIPMVWTGGANREKGREVKGFGSQTDIAATLLNQMGIEADFRFSKNLLDPNSPSYAFYTYNEGFGFITDSSAVIYDHKLKGPVLSEGQNPSEALRRGKACLQVLFDDYLKR